MAHHHINLTVDSEAVSDIITALAPFMPKISAFHSTPAPMLTASGVAYPKPSGDDILKLRSVVTVLRIVRGAPNVVWTMDGISDAMVSDGFAKGTASSCVSMLVKEGYLARGGRSHIKLTEKGICAEIG